MTHASEFFSWYAGSVKADTYFCPERHGTCFGGFYMKDMPAMGKRDFDISTSVTGDSGREFLSILTEDQRQALVKLRKLDGYTSAPAYIYSDPVNGPVNLPSTDSFFFPPTS
jgi:hypothetical protein